MNTLINKTKEIEMENIKKHYVDSHALLEYLYEANAIDGRTAKLINQFPAADVMEVRHGQWNEVEHGENGVLCECSACKEWMLFYYGFNANYCPNCGARMDLSDKIYEANGWWYE